MTGEKPVPDREPFTVDSVRCGFLPGIDPLKLNQLVDELEVDEFLERTARSRHGRPSIVILDPGQVTCGLRLDSSV